MAEYHHDAPSDHDQGEPNRRPEALEHQVGGYLCIAPQIPFLPRKLAETSLEESIRYEEYRYAGQILVVSDMEVFLHAIQLSDKRVCRERWTLGSLQHGRVPWHSQCSYGPGSKADITGSATGLFACRPSELTGARRYQIRRHEDCTDGASPFPLHRVGARQFHL